MATQAASPEKFIYRTSPTATEAFEGWLKEHGQELPKHTHPWDVSRSDIYVEDRWQPIFAEMRAKEPVNYVPESPYGPYWNIVSSKAIQHVEALPELYSSSWQYGGITITEPPKDVTEEQLAEEAVLCARELEKSAVKRTEKELVGALAEAEQRGDRAASHQIAMRLEALAKRLHN